MEALPNLKQALLDLWPSSATLEADLLEHSTDILQEDGKKDGEIVRLRQLVGSLEDRLSTLTIFFRPGTLQTWTITE